MDISITGAGNVGSALAQACTRAGRSVTLSSRDASDAESGSNAETIQSMVQDVPVVKAFSTVLAANQADPNVDGVQLDGFVAADDERARNVVLDLVQSLGYRPIDAGPLAAARALEGMGTLNISLNMSNGWPWQTGWKLVGPTS